MVASFRKKHWEMIDPSQLLGCFDIGPPAKEIAI